MIEQYSTPLIVCGFSVLTLVFGAGGLVTGLRIQSSNNKEKDHELAESIKNLDKVKQSKLICTERHSYVNIALRDIKDALVDIKDDIKWIRENNGGS